MEVRPPNLAQWLGAALLFAALGAYGQYTAEVSIERVYPSLAFEKPTGLYPVPGVPGRWWLLEQEGRIRAFDSTTGEAGPETVVDISDRVEAGPSEAGLLGLAFHPDYPATPTVFLSYTREGDPLVSYISRFTTRNGRVEPDSEEVVLTVEQPFGNHNGGGIGFGPEGYLFIGLGDGGSGGDPFGHAQNRETLLGAILRIDVLTPGDAPYTIPPDNPFADGRQGAPELYAWGLRNPWRWSFDEPTGRMWAADVGQEAWEEVDIIVEGGNYGWDIREGNHCYRASECRSEGLIFPVAEYSHELGCSITGGHVYRGEAIPALHGEYLFGDFCSGRLWALTEAGNRGWTKRPLLNTVLWISFIAQGHDGESYLLDYADGGVYKLVPR